MPPVIDNGSTGRIPLYCVLSSDHISPATGKTIAVTISKNGAAFGNPSGGATNATEIGSGWYYFTPSATDTGTNGPLIVLGTNADIDNSTRDYLIAPSIAYQVWDEVNTGATHNIQNSTGKQLRTLTVNTGVIYTGTAPSQAGMTNVQIKLDAGASAVNQAYQWDIISIISGTGAGQSAVITNYVGSTKVITVDSPWVVQPDNTSVFEITPTAQVQVISYVAGQDPATLVLGATAASWNTAGTIGAAINTSASSGDPWLTPLPGAYVAGTAGYILGTNLDAPVSGIDAATIAAAVWDEVNTASTHNIDNSTGKQLRAISGSSITIYSSTLPSQSGVPANQVKLDAGASSSNGAYVGAAIWAVSGTGQGGGVCISYIGSTRMATIHTNWAVAPVGGDVVEVVPTGIATVAGYISGQDPATLVWDAPVRTLTDFGFTVTIGGLPPIPNNWITANGINAAALNGKGDWLTTKTGYSLDLTQAIPATNGIATMGDALNAALSMGFGNQIVDASAKTLTMYQRNGNTITKVFNLDSATAPKTRT